MRTSSTNRENDGEKRMMKSEWIHKYRRGSQRKPMIMAAFGPHTVKRSRVDGVLAMRKRMDRKIENSFAFGLHIKPFQITKPTNYDYWMECVSINANNLYRMPMCALYTDEQFMNLSVHNLSTMPLTHFPIFEIAESVTLRQFASQP